MALIDLKHITLAFGGLPVLDRANLRIQKGERICLLGRNGEGKTTLLRLLGGEIRPDSGEIARSPGLRVALLPQELPHGMSGTLAEVVTGGLPPAGPADDESDRSTLVNQILTRADLVGEADYSSQSTGNKRRTIIARALAAEPDILLLDEPTNHLDINAIARLEAELRRSAVTLVFVTHDRAFLRALAGRIVEIDRGRLRDWTCEYDTFLTRRDEQLAVEEKQNAEFDRKLAEEEAWLRQGIKARRTRNEGRVRALESLRDERSGRRMQTGSAEFSLQNVQRTGKQVIRAKDLSFSWGDNVMVDAFSTRIARGDKVGILGPNGSGKTTLLRLLLGKLTPSEGEIGHGTKLQVAYYDQRRDQLDESKTVQENITEGSDMVEVNGQSVHIVTYLKQFLFAPDRARAPISRLSGGERNRLLLAKLFTRPANLLVLDEPTNDLDIETVELLESLLVEFSGTLLLVSHDREFLDNVTTSTLVLEGNGRIAETVGGYSDWERTTRKPAVAKKAHKPKPQPKSSGPRRLTWKERKELEALPATIEALETEQSDLHTRVADPVFYREAGEQVAAATTRLDELTAELEILYARWQELELASEDA